MDNMKEKMSVYSQADEDMKDGARGFSPQYSGNGIVGISETSSFDVQAGGADMATRSKGAGSQLIGDADENLKAV